MYLQHWKLREKPFENTPDSRFFYASKLHTEAIGRLVEALIKPEGCVLLTAEHGCGKTALARRVIESLDPDRYVLALINYPIFSSTEFLREILFQYGQDSSAGSNVELFEQLSGFGYQNLVQYKQSIVVIDEAHVIEDSEMFRQIWSLSNLRLQNRPLFSILLIGQPELAQTLTRCPELNECICGRPAIEPFGPEDVVGYIRHRIRIAGGAREMFSPEAYAAISRSSRGIPSRINQICDLCLLDGCLGGAQVVDDDIVAKIR